MINDEENEREGEGWGKERGGRLEKGESRRGEEKKTVFGGGGLIE